MCGGSRVESETSNGICSEGDPLSNVEGLHPSNKDRVTKSFIPGPWLL